LRDLVGDLKREREKERKREREKKRKREGRKRLREKNRRCFFVQESIVSSLSLSSNPMKS